MSHSACKLGRIVQSWSGVWIALGLLACVCGAQQYSFNTLTQGLGNLNLNCIAQDASGYLWVGTQNGLYRFDGREFLEFGARNGIQGHTIQNLFAAPDGTLFVSTANGIYFKRQDEQFAQIRPPAPVTDFSPRIGSVMTALDHDRVVTADRSGAYLLRRTAPDTWSAEAMHLDGHNIWSVLASQDGTLWYGCDSDLCRLKDGKTTHLRSTLNLPEERWQHLLLARDGHLWIRGPMHVGELSPVENRFEAHDLPVRSNAAPYSDLAQDGQGHIVASQGASFGLWQNSHWRMITTANGLSHYDIAELFVDREGSLWFGVVGHGLTRWVGQDDWEAYTTANGLSDEIVWGTLRDRAGRLWIGTESGLDSLLPGANTVHAWQTSGIRTARSASLAEGRDGAIWVGSVVGTLVRIDPRSQAGTEWKIPEVNRVLSDGGPRIWAATESGLYVADTAAVDRSPHLVEDAIFAHPGQRFTDLSLEIVPGKASRLWTTGEDGIYDLDEKGWHHIDLGLSGAIPVELAADAKGNLWASGAFPGVLRMRIEDGRVVESEHFVRPHLLSEQAVALLVDHRGWVWVGQDAGVSVYDGHNWRSLTQDDGLIWNDVDSYALAEDRDGSIWIGTSAGLSHLMHPETLSAGPPPAPLFSQITFGNRTVDDGSDVDWMPSPLSISMVTLSYRDASHMHIRYRLLGLEQEWVETGERSLRYPRLEPGSYRFQAQAVDGTSGALSPLNEISFVITPLWWQSEPLRLFFVLLLAVGVVLAWRWSLQLLVRQKRQLETAVERRTEDLEREKSELLRAREQMRHFAEHDDLTGLWNHRIIMERLRQEVDRSRRERSPLSVILVDLDNFKNVNDTYGHQAGDLVLKQVGAIFARAVRSYDWVGRYGGEEFLLILPGSGFSGGSARAEELRSAVQSAHIHDGHRPIPITASFGVASGFTSNYEALIQAADTALYRAKGNGRNCVMATEVDPDEASGRFPS